MNKIKYDVPLIKQAPQECLQSSTAQLMKFYTENISVDEILEEIPVHKNSKGEPLGTSVGQVASFFVSKGFKVTLYVAEPYIFDPSWKNIDDIDLIELLKKRKGAIKHHAYDSDTLNIIIDDFINFIKDGGKIIQTIYDEKFLHNLLSTTPFIAIVNWNFLNSISKGKYDKGKKTYVRDAIRGNLSTHAVVVSGYEKGRFLLVDPDYEFGGKRWVSASLLVGSIYLAESGLDSILLSMKPRK